MTVDRKGVEPRLLYQVSPYGNKHPVLHPVCVAVVLFVAMRQNFIRILLNLFIILSENCWSDKRSNLITLFFTWWTNSTMFWHLRDKVWYCYLQPILMIINIVYRYYDMWLWLKHITYTFNTPYTLVDSVMFLLSFIDGLSEAARGLRDRDEVQENLKTIQV